MTHVMEIRHAEASIFGGRVQLDPATYRPGWARAAQGHRAPSANRHDFKARASFEGVDPWRVLGAESFGLEIDTLPFLKGAVEGSCLMQGDIEEETGQVDIEVASDGLAITWAGAADLPLATRYEVNGRVHWRSGPSTSMQGRKTLTPIHRLDLHLSLIHISEPTRPY